MAFTLDPSAGATWAAQIDPQQQYAITRGINQGQSIIGSALTDQYRPVDAAQLGTYQQANPLVNLPTMTVGGQSYLPISYFGDSGSGGAGSAASPSGTSTSSGGSGTAPASSAFGAFVPPDPSQTAQNPAYQFALAQGNQQIQNSAAARGTLLSGATAKALDQFGQGAASQYYQQDYNNALNAYQANLGTHQANFGDATTTFQGNQAAQAQAFNQNLATQQQALAAQGQQFGEGLATQQQALAAQGQQFGQGLASGQFGLSAQGQQFNQGLAAYNAALGAQAQQFGEGQQRYQDQSTASNAAYQRALQAWQLGLGPAPTTLGMSPYTFPSVPSGAGIPAGGVVARPSSAFSNLGY